MFFDTWASDEKMDSIQLEYTYLLTNQLESQRRYFEEKISRVEDSAKREIDDMVALTRTTAEETKVMFAQWARKLKVQAKKTREIK